MNAWVFCGLGLLGAVVMWALLRLMCSRAQRARRGGKNNSGLNMQSLHNPLLPEGTHSHAQVQHVAGNAAPCDVTQMSPSPPGGQRTSRWADSQVHASGGSGGSGDSATARRTAAAFTAASLAIATDGFAHVLGEGSFGSVYRGVLRDGRVVAVKRVTLAPESSSTNKYAGEQGFRRELQALQLCRHPNVVALLGYCVEVRSAASAGAGSMPHGLTTFSLVLEFMGGGSLSERLQQPQQPQQPQQTQQMQQTQQTPPLTVIERFDIAADVARGLYYLHAEAASPLIHQDMKSENVLIGVMQPGGRLVAKVADFGTARSLATENGSGYHSTVTIVGSRPYMPAEYLQAGHVSEKTDTYAYGVVLLELLTGRPPFDEERHALLSFDMDGALQEPEALLPPFLDASAVASAGGEWPAEPVAALARVAARCLDPRVHHRCTVRDVVGEVLGLARAVAASPLAGERRRSQSAEALPLPPPRQTEQQGPSAVSPSPNLALLVENDRGLRLTYNSIST